MNLDLQEYIEILYCEVAEKLKPHGWARKDISYFEYKPNSKNNIRGKATLPESWVAFTPDLLEYTEGNKWVTKIWLKSSEEDLSTEAKEKLFQVFKPFTDEDYSGYNFWINPLQPDGYWSNHALGD